MVIIINRKFLFFLKKKYIYIYILIQLNTLCKNI